jgi:hypothetical protein
VLGRGRRHARFLLYFNSGSETAANKASRVIILRSGSEASVLRAQGRRGRPGQGQGRRGAGPPVVLSNVARSYTFGCDTEEGAGKWASSPLALH